MTIAHLIQQTTLSMAWGFGALGLAVFAQKEDNRLMFALSILVLIVTMLLTWNFGFECGHFVAENGR